MNEELFWKRADILYKAWQQAKHEDMQNIWKWKLIDLMKIMSKKSMV
jgi:hypothetical protein